MPVNQSYHKKQPPPCPYLPEPLPDMDWKSLAACRDKPGSMLYLTALRYTHYLWQRGLAARALLAAERALFCPLKGDEAVLRNWPLPYLPIAWMVNNHSGDTFIGNPRVHFQHLADRVRGNGSGLKSARAWFCWHLVRTVAPHYPADPLHQVTVPDVSALMAVLAAQGLPGEPAVARQALDITATWPKRSG